jgi:heptosyltransferase-2
MVSRFSPAQSLNTELKNALVIRGGAIGDFILTLPAIKALRDAFPNARLELLGYKHIAALAENPSYAQQIRSIESAELSGLFVKDSDLPAALANYFAKFEVIVSYLYDPDLIFEANLRRAGAQKVIRGPAKIDTAAHATHQLARPIEELGVPVPDLSPRLYLSDEDRDVAREFLAGLATPMVAFHPGSGSKKKNWPLQNWISLGNHFLTISGGSLIIVSGEADEARIARLELIWRNPRVRFAKNLPLPGLAALLANTVFFGQDSGISHLAAAAGGICIVLFGPADPEIWAPLNPNARVIRAPKGDMRRLNVDIVRAALDQELMRIGIST